MRISVTELCLIVLALVAVIALLWGWNLTA